MNWQLDKWVYKAQLFQYKEHMDVCTQFALQLGT